MATERTNEQILEEAVYAALRAIRHYGPGLSDEGLQSLRKAIADSVGPFTCDSNWRVDVYEEDAVDFHELLPVVQSPADHCTDFDYQVRASKGLLIEDVDYVVVG